MFGLIGQIIFGAIVGAIAAGERGRGGLGLGARFADGPPVVVRGVSG